ncbi:MAG: C-GCAxxG-C-C family protein [archaeon]|nr:C-GCAxxG-C-C family protein [archaeon]
MDLDCKLVKEKIEDYRKEYNCAQSTLLGICEVAGLPTKELATLTKGFGGGIGGTFDEGTCGAVTGAILALGFLGADEDQIFNCSKEVFNSFKEEYGSTTCGVISKSGEDKSPCIEVCLFAGEKVCECLK